MTSRLPCCPAARCVACRWPWLQPRCLWAPNAHSALRGPGGRPGEEPAWNCPSCSHPSLPPSGATGKAAGLSRGGPHPADPGPRTDVSHQDPGGGDSALPSLWLREARCPPSCSPPAHSPGSSESWLRAVLFHWGRRGRGEEMTSSPAGCDRGCLPSPPSLPPAETTDAPRAWAAVSVTHGLPGNRRGCWAPCTDGRGGAQPPTPRPPPRPQAAVLRPRISQRKSYGLSNISTPAPMKGHSETW